LLVANSSAWQEDSALLDAAFEALGSADLDVVATVAAEHHFGATLPPNVRVCGFVPHGRLLPQVDAVVTTGGFGLVTKSLWCGLPVVVAPFARDQPYVAAAVADAGCGIDIGWPPTAAAVAGAVRTVLTSPDLRERACRMAGPVAGHPGPSQVAARVLALGARP
jgi:UDP:flavonoid glycosyltransferase YjiC (YdhE family)